MEAGLVFGLNIGELLTIYDRDSQSWKMSECLFTGDYAKYSEAFPKSGIMLNGRIYEQATWVPRTGAKESGLWPIPTPQASDGLQGEILNEKTEIIFLKSGKPRKISNQGVSGSVGLSRYAQIMWRTPDTCAGGTKSKAQYEKAKKTGCNAIRLQDQVKHEISWPTPQSRDYKGKDSENRDCLPNAVHWRTPAAHDPGVNPKRLKPIEGGELGGMNRHFDKHTGRMAQIGLTQQAALRDGAGNGGQLNAEFVEWLMNYPKGWTEMD